MYEIIAIGIAALVVIMSLRSNSNFEAENPPPVLLETTGVVCYKQDLIKVLTPHIPNLDSVLFCKGNCDIANPGQTCTVACADGLQQSGFNQFLCQGDGTWANTPEWPFSCLVSKTTCPPIWPTDFIGIVPGTKCIGAQPGDSCSIYCHVGTSASVSTAKCQPNGTWDSTLQCTRQTCGGVNCVM